MQSIQIFLVHKQIFLHSLEYGVNARIWLVFYFILGSTSQKYSKNRDVCVYECTNWRNRVYNIGENELDDLLMVWRRGKNACLIFKFNSTSKLLYSYIAGLVPFSIWPQRERKQQPLRYEWIFTHARNKF